MSYRPQIKSNSSGALTDLAIDAETVKGVDVVNTKQDKLISGTNIKTLNGNSLLGSGDLTISSNQHLYRHNVSFMFLGNPTDDELSYTYFTVYNNDATPITTIQMMQNYYVAMSTSYDSIDANKSNYYFLNSYEVWYETNINTSQHGASTDNLSYLQNVSINDTVTQIF